MALFDVTASNRDEGGAVGQVIAKLPSTTFSAGVRTSAWAGTRGWAEFYPQHAGGIRGADGKPIALGYHSGHYEVGLLMQAAAEELHRLGYIPFAGFCSDPCDGRTQGTPGMMDSLPFRNDAAQVLRRLIRSLPTRQGVLGVATCDKGLPAMMMALASMHDLPCVLVPGGVMLATSDGEDTGKVQSIGARFAHGEITLEQASDAGCRVRSPGGGCQFLGTAATSQVVAEALGMALPHSRSHLGPTDLARHGTTPGRALAELAARGIHTPDPNRRGGA